MRAVHCHTGEIVFCYEHYLLTQHWKTLSWRIKQGGSCVECGEKNNLCVHHISYDRIGRERDEDLEVVCKTCHIRKHHHGHGPSCPLPLHAPAEMPEAGMEYRYGLLEIANAFGGDVKECRDGMKRHQIDMSDLRQVAGYICHEIWDREH